MNSDVLILSTIIALDIVIGFKTIKSYGNARYMRGKLDGFNECVKLNEEVINKVKEEIYARDKAKSGGEEADA